MDRWRSLLRQRSLTTTLPNPARPRASLHDVGVRRGAHERERGIDTVRVRDRPSRTTPPSLPRRGTSHEKDPGAPPIALAVELRHLLAKLCRSRWPTLFLSVFPHLCRAFRCCLHRKIPDRQSRPTRPAKTVKTDTTGCASPITFSTTSSR